MVFKRLQDSQDSLYLQAMQLYQSSFPLHEQRKPDAQRAILKEPDYQFNLLMEEDHLMGELLCWETQEFIYVEHLCILPQLRGQHCGSRALELLEQRGKPVILEIDPPVDDISIRRRHFYERLGFVANPYEYIHPSFRKPFTPHQLILMSYPGPLTYDEARGFADFVRETVLGYSEHEAPTLPKLP